MSEEFKPGSGEQDSNRQGDAQDDSVELSELIETLDSETQEAVLEVVNKATKKDFKGIDGLVKSLREGDKLGIELGQLRKQLKDKPDKSDADKQSPKGDEQEPKKEAPSVISPVIKGIYFKQNPEVEHVWDEVLEAAKDTGRDPFEVYESSRYFQGEAKARAEAKAKDQSNLDKVTPPGTKPGSGEISYAEIDLENPEHVKWLKGKDGRLEKYNEWLKTNNFAGFR